MLILINKTTNIIKIVSFFWIILKQTQKELLLVMKKVPYQRFLIWFLSHSFDNKRGYHSLHWFLLVRLWVIGSNAAGDRRLFWTRLCKTIAIFYNMFLKYFIIESYSCTLNKHFVFLKISKLPLEPSKNRT